MAADNPKIPSMPGDIADRVNALIGRVVKLGEEGKKTTLSLDALNKIEKKLGEESSRAKKGTVDLAKAVKVLGQESGIAQEATSRLASEFAKGMDTMSSSQKKLFQKAMEDIKAAEGTAGAKGDQRDMNILSEKRRQMEAASYRDSLQQEVLRAKAMQTSGGALQRLQGMTSGLWSKAKLLKADTMEKVGGAMGMTGESMAAMTGPLVIITGVFLALSAILKGAARHATEAAEAGFDVGESLSSATKTGNEFSQAMFKASYSAGMSRDQILGLTKVFNVEMGQSITHSADEAVMLARNLGGAGLTFGIAADEAVKLGTKMGVLARGGVAGTRILFENLGEGANSLNVNLEVLADPMMQLAEASGAAGSGIMDSVEGFNSILGAAKGLSSVGGAFNQMFASMRDADKAKAVKSFVTNFSKIDDIRWSAFSMKRGDNFFDTVGKVSTSGVQEKLGYIKDLTQRLGIDKMKNQTQKEFTLGSILSGGQLTGDFKASRELGRMALLSQKTGEGFDAQSRTAGLIDQRFARRESIGQYMAGGGDMLALIAHKLENILDVLTSFASNITKSLKFLPGMPSDVSYATPNYGSKQSAMQRQAGPVRGAAIRG